MNTLDAQIQVTRRMIEVQGVDIALVRTNTGWSTSPAGGQVASKGDGKPQSAQRRFFGRPSANDTLVVITEGDIETVAALLIGPPGDDIQKFDRFVGPDGLPYEVRF